MQTCLPQPLRQLKHGLTQHAGGDRIMAQVLAAVPVAGLDALLTPLMFRLYGEKPLAALLAEADDEAF